MIPQISTILHSVSLVLVVLAIKALITPHRVSCHLIWPFKEQLILDLLQNLVHWFSEHRINHVSISRPWLPNKVSPRSVVIVPIRPEIPPLWWITLALPFPCCWSSSTLLYLSIWSMSWCTLVTGFPVKDFLKPCLAGRPTLKVLMTTSSKSLSLNISQYLSEYVFRVSPSHMDKDNRESKGRVTLLQVIKRESNA